MTDQHNPNCAIVRLGDIRAWCDCGADRMKALEAENERLRSAISWAEKIDPDLVFAIRIHAACGAALEKRNDQ